jgi:hypothetical protein
VAAPGGGRSLSLDIESVFYSLGSAPVGAIWGRRERHKTEIVASFGAFLAHVIGRGPVLRRRHHRVRIIHSHALRVAEIHARL